MSEEYVTVKMPVNDYLDRSTGLYAAVEGLAAEHGGRWIGSGTDMTTGMSDVQYGVPTANAAALVEAMTAAGLFCHIWEGS